MSKTNTLFLNDKELTNVVIETDMQGHSEINMIRNLKYSRILKDMNDEYYLCKNILLIDDEYLCNVIVISDINGNNTIESLYKRKTEKEPTSDTDIFKNVLVKLHNQKASEQPSIEAYLNDKRNSFYQKLFNGTMAFNIKNYVMASEFYQNALAIYDKDSYPDEFGLTDNDIFSIKFALCLSNIAQKKNGPLQTASEILPSLIFHHGETFPSLYLLLAKVYSNFENHKKAIETLETGLKVLEKCDKLTELFWPGTEDKMVVQTEKQFLKDNMNELLKKCKVFRLPDAKCCFTQCSAASINMFFSCPNFCGYVNLKCSENCNFNYHRNCWKLRLKADSIKKPSTLLNKPCDTNSCSGVYLEIKIYDENLHVNAVIKDKEACSLAKKIDKNSVNANNEKTVNKNDLENNCIFKPPSRQVGKKAKKAAEQENKKIQDNSKATAANLKTNNADTANATGKRSRKNSSSTDNVLKNAKSSDVKVESKKSQTKKETVKGFNPDAPEFMPDKIIKEEPQKNINTKLNTNAKEYAPPKKNLKVKPEPKEETVIKVNHDQINEFDVNLSNEIKQNYVPYSLNSEVAFDHDHVNSKFNLDAKEYVPIINDDKNNLNGAANNFVYATSLYPTPEYPRNNESPPSRPIMKDKGFQTISPEYQSIAIQSVVDSCDETTQTNNDFDACQQIKLLKSEINELYFNLFESEDAYNDVVYKYNVLQEQIKNSCVQEVDFYHSNHNLAARIDVSTQTVDSGLNSTSNEQKSECKNCVPIRAENNSMSTYAYTKTENGCTYLYQESHSYNGHCMQQNQYEINKYTSTINELRIKNAALVAELENHKRAILIEKKNFVEYQRKCMEQQDMLVKKNKDMENMVTTVVKEYQEFQKKNAAIHWRKVLLELIHYIRNEHVTHIVSNAHSRSILNSRLSHMQAGRFDLNDISSRFQSKCKHMIWELDDLKKLSTSDSMPSTSEIDENILLWNKALSDAIACHTSIIQYYDNIFKKFLDDNLEFSLGTVPSTLIPEPPNIMLRHFKAIVVLNKKLEQDRDMHIMNFYKMMSMPYPGLFPSNQAMSNNLSLVSQNQGIEQHVKQEVIPDQSAFRPDSTDMNATTFMQDAASAVVNEKTQVTATTTSGVLNGVIHSPQSHVRKDSLLGAISKRVNNEPKSGQKSDLVPLNQYLAQTGKKKVASSVDQPGENGPKQVQSSSRVTMDQFFPLPSDKRKQTVPEDKSVVGPSALLYKLQQKFPLVPPRMLEEAIQILRERYGKLTGMQGNEILEEVRTIVRNISTREKAEQNRPVVQSPQPPAWKKINNDVQWQNNHPDKNCTICFEAMTPKNSVKLKCQHIYHTACIKKWLQNDSICPICRSFTTLDDEFPPLM